MNQISATDASGSQLPTSMTAWTTAGDGVANLRRTTVALPEPADYELLVRISAQSLNFRDLLVVDGRDHWRPERPVVPVSDGVGTVVATGRAVTRFDVGDRVSALFLPAWHDGPLTSDTYVDPVGGPVNRGMLADFVLIAENEAVAPPATLTDLEAATLPVAGLTAWHAVAERCRIAAGETVLIHGTGGVALFAAQFAHARGARVAVTSSWDDKLARAEALGAERPINYATHDVVQDVLAWTRGRGVDHVIETVGGANLNTSLRAVAIGGTVAFIGLIAGRAATINTYEFVTKNVTVHGIETGSRAMYERMSRFIDDHRIRPVIGILGAPDTAAHWLTELRGGNHFGKIVLDAAAQDRHRPQTV